MITNSEFEIDHLFCKGGHVIVEATTIFTRLVGREDKIALSFLGPFQDDLLVRSDDAVVDIERAAGLDLFPFPFSGVSDVCLCIM